MIDALSVAQKKKSSTRASTSSLASACRFTGSTTTLPIYLDDKAERQREKAKLPSWISSTALASSSPSQTLPSAALRSSPSSGSSASSGVGVNRSMSFNDSLGMRRAFAQSVGSLTGSSAAAASGALFGASGRAPTTTSTSSRSSVQRLIETFENENRRHFEEFQRINSELRRKLENSVQQEEMLRDLVRLRQEKIRQQEILLKNQTDTEKRLENANRRLQDMLKDIQLREADIIRQQGDYDALQRRHDAETRKAEEVRQTLNSEIARLVRENERQEQLVRRNEELRAELEAKNAEIRRLSRPNDEIQRLNERLELLNSELVQVSREKRELEENQVQGPVCGVCMDNRREVIFMPCLHFTCCKSCANSLDHCMICRLRIMGKIEFFQ